jgi:hypothetical protein
MRIDFEKDRHEYRIDGIPVPSVTQVIKPLENFEGIPLDVLEAARVFGQHVHEACALLVRDLLDWSSLDSALVPYLIGAKRFLDESGITVIASEMRLACPRLRVAGSLDLIGVLSSSEAVLDFKVTAAVPYSVGPQTSAYERLYRNMFGGQPRKRYCVLLQPEDYRVTRLTDPADWNIFLSCLNLHHWKHTHAT